MEVTEKKPMIQKRGTVLNVITMGKKCYFCDSYNTRFCSMCEQWLCDFHRKNYPKRAWAMIQEKILKRKQRNH